MSVGEVNYIGVSGVTSPEQQAVLREHAEEMFKNVDATLALGVKAVHKTQWLDVPNKYGEAWYPVGEESFAGALTFAGRTDNIAQIYLDPETLSHDPQYATNFIRRIKQRGQNWLHLIQFDKLPYLEAPEAVSYIIHEAKRDVDVNEYMVVVQCYEEAMNEGPKSAIEKLKRLSPDEIDFVLFDASHGTGKEMDPSKLAPFLAEAYGDPNLNLLGVGIAGGLDAEMVKKHLPQLLKDYPYLSWDAEGRLHKTPDGSLDMVAAKEYLTASAEVLQGL